jgi:DNA-binding HxlR family transcriptional regulator
MSNRTFSFKLQEMLNDGLLTRKVFTTRPVQVRYCLTKRGQELAPIFNELLLWSQKHFKERPQKAQGAREVLNRGGKKSK